MWSRDEVATLSPHERAELEALDRALAGEAVEPPHLGVEAVVAAVREQAPRIDPGYEARLQARLRAPTRARRPRRTLLAGGGLAAAAAAAAVAVILAGGGASRPHVATPLPAEGAGQATPSVAQAPSAGASASGPSALGSTATSTAAPTRQVQRDATLQLTVDKGRVQAAADRVVALTEGAGGVVLRSSVLAGDQAPGQATFTLQLPAAQLDSSIAALSALGHVASLTQTAQDITHQVNVAGGRLARAQAERRALQARLAQATTPALRTAIRGQLAANAQQIAVDTRALAALQRAAGYSTVELTLIESSTGSATGASGGGPWTPGAALDDALTVLETAFGVLVVGLSALAAPALVLGLAGWGVALGRRRRREHALDSA